MLEHKAASVLQFDSVLLDKTIWVSRRSLHANSVRVCKLLSTAGQAQQSTEAGSTLSLDLDSC